MRKIIWIVPVLLLAVAPQAMWAGNITYNYTGNDFTNVLGPYTTSDFVSATFSLSAALPANLSTLTDETSLLGSYTISDSVQTLTNTNSNIVFFSFMTNSSGSIIGWNFEADTGLYPDSFISSTNDVDYGSYLGGTVAGGGGAGGNGSSPGVWSSSVPEPATFSMMLLGLLGLGLLAGMKRWHCNRPATEA